VIVEFDFIEKARDWYESEGYQAAKAMRQAATTSNAVLVNGFVPPCGGHGRSP
jgi:uncharacterized protein (DUF1330 family)